jgi:hypothetical protein
VLLILQNVTFEGILFVTLLFSGIVPYFAGNPLGALSDISATDILHRSDTW